MRLAVRTSAFAIIAALGMSLAACAPEAKPVRVLEQVLKRGAQAP